jgi:hypothetical protein
MGKHFTDFEIIIEAAVLWLKETARRKQITLLTFGTGVLHLIQINHQPYATVFSLLS